jgi:hypothetical protein
MAHGYGLCVLSTPCYPFSWVNQHTSYGVFRVPIITSIVIKLSTLVDV